MPNRIVAAVDPESGLVEARTESGQALPMDSDGLEAPSPIEGLLASLAGCTAVDVASILRKKRQSAVEYEIVVDGDRAEEHPRVFTRDPRRAPGAGCGRARGPASVDRAVRDDLLPGERDAFGEWRASSIGTGSSTNPAWSTRPW